MLGAAGPLLELRSEHGLGRWHQRRSSFLAPLPIVCTLAPVDSVMSWQVSPASSEIRSPVWIASTNIA